MAFVRVTEKELAANRANARRQCARQPERRRTSPVRPNAQTPVQLELPRPAGCRSLRSRRRRTRRTSLPYLIFALETRYFDPRIARRLPATVPPFDVREFHSAPGQKANRGLPKTAPARATPYGTEKKLVTAGLKTPAMAARAAAGGSSATPHVPLLSPAASGRSTHGGAIGDFRTVSDLHAPAYGEARNSAEPKSTDRQDLNCLDICYLSGYAGAIPKDVSEVLSSGSVTGRLRNAGPYCSQSAAVWVLSG